MRLVVLVDGEHYPPVVRAAIGRLRASGEDIVAAIFCGGSEKVTPGDLDSAYGIALERGPDLKTVLDRVLAEHRPDAVLDLSDEPVLRPHDRFRLASVALRRGVSYRGPDFELRPPALTRVLTKPSIRVIATGKRTGKTAVAGAIARRAAELGRRPVIVAMGRGGPDSPTVVEAGTKLGAAELLAIADGGMHAASDYLEDAVTSGVTTIGCRRVGGGLAGAPFESNVVRGAEIAERRDEDLVVLEGSGAAIPPVAARATLLCVHAATGAAVAEFLGAYRLLLADLVVVTMAEDEASTALTESAIRGVSPQVEVVRAVLRPSPLTNIDGRRAFFCTTAPPEAARELQRHLEESHGCEITGMSHALADRSVLEADLSRAGDYDVLLTELKGAAVDVAARAAVRADREVVFVDNALVGDAVAGALDRLIRLAVERSDADTT